MSCLYNCEMILSNESVNAPITPIFKFVCLSSILIANFNYKTQYYPLESLYYIHYAAAAKSLQLCSTLRDPMDCSLPGSSVHGIFQVRVLEWGAIAFSNILCSQNLFILWLKVCSLFPPPCQPLETTFLFSVSMSLTFFFF